MPGQIARNGIIDPTVNNPTDVTVPQQPPAAPAPATPGTAVATPMDTLIAQVSAMNSLLSQILSAEQAQAAGIDGLNRAVGRPTFSDNEQAFKLFNRI